MLSYAQNFEDVILARALRDVQTGFYVDVGAWHPEIDSVTRHFYDAGWRGVNIEPQPVQLDLLRGERPRDANLGVAIGARKGRAKFHIMSGSGLSTLYPDLASGHRTHGFTEDEVIAVDVVSLNSVFRFYAPEIVNFLKIDCEGAEAKVINAFDLKRFRPWIIVVEATKPLTREESYSAWEPHLLEFGYDFVYFDGLNRFYLAAEKRELTSAFAVPPNIFDKFVIARYANEIERLRSRLDELQAKPSARRWRRIHTKR
jgi:FkbM family methyltransferase